MTDSNDLKDFDRNLSYRAETEQREAELADARTALAAAEQRLLEAYERAEYLGWNGSASRAHDEALARVSAARRAVWRAKRRRWSASIHARLSGL